MANWEVAQIFNINIRFYQDKTETFPSPVSYPAVFIKYGDCFYNIINYNSVSGYVATPFLYI